MHLVMDIFVKGSGLVDCGVWVHGGVFRVSGGGVGFSVSGVEFRRCV